MRLPAILVAALLGAGCATVETFNARMNSFIGQPQSALIARYGLPEASMQLATGETIMQYTRGSVMVMPGATTVQPVVSTTTGTVTTPVPIGAGVLPAQTSQFEARTTTYQTQQAPSTQVQFWCTVRFTVSPAGVVTTWAAQGNYCVAQ